MSVNVTIENLAPCKKLVRVEIESKDVDAAFETMIKDFQRQAALPGVSSGQSAEGHDCQSVTRRTSVTRSKRN